MADDLIAGLEAALFHSASEGFVEGEISTLTVRDANLVRRAIAALRTEREPVAWMCEHVDCEGLFFILGGDCPDCRRPLTALRK